MYLMIKHVLQQEHCVYLLIHASAKFLNFTSFKTTESQVCCEKGNREYIGLETVETDVQIVSYYHIICVSSQKQTKNGMMFFSMNSLQN